MSCKFDVDIALECDEVIVPGVRDRMILLNHEDLGAIVYDGANPLLATGLSMINGTRAYSFVGRNGSIEPNERLAQDTYQKLFFHDVTFRVFSDSPEAKKFVQDMVNGKAVAILETNNNKFEIYGVDAGLELKDFGNNRSDPNEVGYRLDMGTNEDRNRESKLPLSLLVGGDFASTRTFVDSLLTIA